METTTTSNEQGRTGRRPLTLFVALLLAMSALAACGNETEAVTTGADGASSETADGAPAETADGAPSETIAEPADGSTDQPADGSTDQSADGSTDNEVPSDMTGDYQRTQAMTDLLDPRVARIDELVVDDDGRTVRVRYQNGTEPCSGARVSVVQSSERVEVRLETGAHPDAATMSCIAMIQSYELTVTLDEPLGDRELIAQEPDGDQALAPDDPASGAVFGTEYYVGLSLDEALEMATVEGRKVRIAVQDGEAFMLTEDYVPSRVNLEVSDGVVTNAWGG